MKLESDSAAEERWEAALNLAEGVRHDNYGRRRTWTWIFLIALLIIVGSGGILIAAVLPMGDRTEPSPGRVWIAGALSVIAFVWIVVVFVHGLRSKSFITRWRAVPSPLNRTERRRVVKQWRGSIAVGGEEFPVVKAAAIQTMVQMDFQFRLWCAMAFIVAVLLLNTELRIVQIMAAASIFAYAIAAVLMFRDRRRITDFLGRNE